MSLLNAWISPQEAIVAVDSDGVSQGGCRLPSSKLLPIPHLNVVLGLRGQLAFLSFLHMRACSAALDSFDDLLAVMPELLAEAEAFTRCSGLTVDTNGALAGNELLAVGWSPREKRMLGLQCVKRGDMPAFSVQEVDRHVSPWHASMQHIRIAPANVAQIARAQVRWMRESFPQAACGGSLIVCRLSRNAMTLRHEFTFQPQDQEATA